MSHRPIPPEFVVPPLICNRSPGARAERLALLVNPFYRKDPHASFGKHVLTPSLALTSIAAATPAGWEVRYWDENLLQGPPPVDPFPRVVGITVHLTFARRAFELARFYRERGAVVVLGGLHVLSCPEECAPHADALALGEGVQVWPRILEDVERGVLLPAAAGVRAGSHVSVALTEEKAVSARRAGRATAGPLDPEERVLGGGGGDLGPPPSEIALVSGGTEAARGAARRFESESVFARPAGQTRMSAPPVRIIPGLPSEFVTSAPRERSRRRIELTLSAPPTGAANVDGAAPHLARRYAGSFSSPPYREDPPPRRDLVPTASFLTTASVIATRGCHNRCGFCYLATDGLRQPYQVRDVGQVVAEIAATGEPYAVFTDNNLGSRPDYLRALCRALRPLEIIWSAAVSIDVTDDPSLVREMALAGCTGVFVGFESLTDRNLAEARKKTPQADDYARRVGILHDNGIQVNASFVLGFDHDDASVFGRTVEWVEANRLECSTFHILTPYPGTPLFRQMEAEGRLLHRNWDLYDTGHVVFRPRRMSVEELAEGYAWCYRRLFSAASIWRRRPADWRAVPPYLAMSYLYKKSNPLWHLLIRHRLVHAAWRPLVEWTRRRHLRFRERLGRRAEAGCEPRSRAGRALLVVSPGV